MFRLFLCEELYSLYIYIYMTVIHPGILASVTCHYPGKKHPKKVADIFMTQMSFEHFLIFMIQLIQLEIEKNVHPFDLGLNDCGP